MELRDLPAVDTLSATLRTSRDLPMAVVTHVSRMAIEQARERIAAGGEADPEQIAESILDDINAARPRSVINATGVLLHTNLGRAAAPTAATTVASEIASSSSNVEVDLRTGRRSKRTDYLGALLPPLTGAQAGFAVNNNAGALLLALASVGSGGSVAVSRGELIEIGGSFRLPDLMKASGTKLVEVGTTNRTRLSDFESVAGSVDALLKVHPSNYRIDGFQEEANATDLAELAHSHNIPFVYDVGSGLIDATTPWLPGPTPGWLSNEPGVRQAISSGADLVLFSGDKLFGGPQAGVVVGTSEAVEAAAKHPIARALRLDGSSIASIAKVIEMYLDQRILDIPFWAMAAATVAEIESRSQSVIEGLPSATIVDGESVPGAGSVPGETIPTRLIEVGGSPNAVWSVLAGFDKPVISVRRDGAVYLDLRSVDPSDDQLVRTALLATV